MKYNNYDEEDENSNNLEMSQSKNQKNLNYKKDDKKGEKQIKNNDFVVNNNSFTESDIDEFKNIFNQNDLKNNDAINNKSYDSSNLFEGSEDINKKGEITLKDLDPKIKEVLILFVLSNDYYQLLVQERAKKAFRFNKVKKHRPFE